MLLDALTSLSPSLAQTLLYGAVVLFVVGHWTYTYSRHRAVPGPFLAKFTDAWRLWAVQSGQSHEIYLRLHEKHGDVVRIGPNCISIRRPGMVSEIYGIGKGFAKSDYYAVWDNFVGGQRVASMVFIRDEKLHAFAKKPIAHAYALSTLKEYEPLLDSTTAVFLSRLDELFAETGEPCDFGTWLQWYAFDVIGELTFSKPFGFLAQAEDVEGIIASIWRNFRTCAILGQMPWVDEVTRKNPIYLKLFAPSTPSPVVSFGQRRVQERLEGKEEEKEEDLPQIKDPALADKVLNGTLPSKPDFLSRFLTLHEEQPDVVPQTRLAAYIFTNINAGSDTVTSTFRAIFYYLLKNPESLELLLEELRNARKEGNLSVPLPTWEECQGLPYLDAVIKEALRLNPALSLPMERIVPEGPGLEVGDHTFPPGTIVGINPWTMGREPRVFGDDADRWNPSRWLTDDEEHIKHMDSHLLAFSTGKRTCLGKHIAMLEMKKLVPALWMRYEITLAEPEREWTLTNFWSVKQTNFKTKLRRRAL